MSAPLRGIAVVPAQPDVIDAAVTQEMTDSITRLIAASVIANPAFPRPDTLPSIDSAPFSSHGHMPFLNYRWMLSRIWQVVAEIQEAIRQYKSKLRRARVIASIIALVIFGFSVALILGAANDRSIPEQAVPTFCFFAFVGGVVIYKIAVAIGKSGLDPFHKTLAKIRVEAVRNLVLRGSDPPVSQMAAAVQQSPLLMGDARLGTGQAPVLTIVNDSHPFPGYGRLQGDTTLVCPPKDGKKLEYPLSEVRQKVVEKVTALVQSSGIRHLSLGEVVVLDGRSISIDDDLLVVTKHGDKIPPLWCDSEKVKAVEQSGRHWCRVYLAIQVLLPAYKTMATLFARPFQAGNSMGYQVAVSTLGPPFEGGGDLLEAIARYELGEAPVDESAQTTNAAPDNLQFTRLRAMRHIARRGPAFQIVAIDLDAIEQLSPTVSAEEQKRADDEAARMLKETMFWPTYSTSVYTFRETHSSTFTTDFFGKPEGLATVRTLYLQISRAILETLESLGYDISDYKNDQGAIVVNAAKIDQLVMGERVSVSQQKATAPGPEASAAAKN